MTQLFSDDVHLKFLRFAIKLAEEHPEFAAADGLDPDVYLMVLRETLERKEAEITPSEKGSEP